MSDYLSTRPDYIKSNVDGYQFKNTLSHLSQGKGYLYRNSTDFFCVALAVKVFETVKGWFGLTNHTDMIQVDYDLLKYLHHGKKNNYISSNIPLLKQMQESLRDTPITAHVPLKKMLNTLINCPYGTVNLKEGEDILMEYYRENEQALQPYLFDRLFTAPTVKKSTTFEYGDTAIALIEKQIDQKDINGAYLEIEKAYKEPKLGSKLDTLLLKLASQKNELEPRHHKAISLKLILAGEKAMRVSDYERASRFFEAANALTPSKALLERFAHAGCLAGNDDVIQKYSEVLIEFHPKDSRTFFQIATSYFKVGKYNEAIHYAKEAFNISHSFEHKKLYAKAILAQIFHILTHPKEEKPSFFMRLFKSTTKDYAASHGYLDKALFLIKQDPSLLNELEIDAFYAVQGDEKVATFTREIAQMYIDRSKETTYLLENERPNHIRSVKPELEKALLWLDTSSRIKPDAETFFLKGCVKEYLQMIDSNYNPHEDYRKAYKMNPDNGYYVWALTLTCSRKGDTKGYNKYLEQFPSGKYDFHMVSEWFKDKFLADKIQPQHKV